MNRLDPAFLTQPLAHRTLHDVTDGRPENSLEGARAAIAKGYGIEVDVQLTRDGQPLVFHDYAMERLMGRGGDVSEISLAEVSEMPLAGGPSAPPSLAEFCKLVNGRVPLLVELKDQDGALGDTASAMEAAVCDILRDYDGPVAVMSFNPNMIIRCATLAPDIPRGLVTDPFTAADWPDVPAARRARLARMDALSDAQASFISHKRADLASAHVARAKGLGLDILCWTVRSKEEENAARKFAQNITFEQYLPSFAPA